MSNGCSEHCYAPAQTNSMTRLTDLATKFPHCRITLELPKEEYGEISKKIDDEDKLEFSELIDGGTGKGYQISTKIGSTEFIIKQQQ